MDGMTDSCCEDKEKCEEYNENHDEQEEECQQARAVTSLERPSRREVDSGAGAHTAYEDLDAQTHTDGACVRRKRKKKQQGDNDIQHSLPVPHRRK